MTHASRERTPRFLAFLFVLAAISNPFALGDEKLAGKACRSVHLGFPGPTASAFTNSITVDKSATGTYFSVCAFNMGYFGLQELGNGKKVVIFSVWEPGNQDDPKKVDESKRVKLIAKGEATRVGRFGNEGTGGQSFLDLDWKIGSTYRFLVMAKPDGERTEFAGYIAAADAKAWTHVATFSTITGGKSLSGYYCFVEDFQRNKISLTEERRARFSDGWILDLKARWITLSRAQFTADSNPSMAIDAGVANGQYFLATGGNVTNAHMKLRSEIDLKPDGILDLP